MMHNRTPGKNTRQIRHALGIHLHVAFRIHDQLRKIIGGRKAWGHKTVSHEDHVRRHVEFAACHGTDRCASVRVGLVGLHADTADLGDLPGGVAVDGQRLG